MSYQTTKRVIDVAVAVVASVVLCPLMLCIALAVKLCDGGPVLFVQQRLGKGLKPFWMVKFRSMVVGAEQNDITLPGDERVTPIGRILRATSLDELPQLYNIICGDMSLVGPLPPQTNCPICASQYDERQRRMFDVRPGLTGWAQVNGRKRLPWPQRIEMNIFYVDNISLMFDLRILYQTVTKVLTNADNVNDPCDLPVADGRYLQQKERL